MLRAGHAVRSNRQGCRVATRQPYVGPCQVPRTGRPPRRPGWLSSGLHRFRTIAAAMSSR